MRRLFRILGIAVCGGVALLGLLAVLLWGNGVLWNRGDNERIIVPNGYRGFVGIFYEQPTMGALKKESGWLLIDFPSTGVIFTSSHLNTGWHKMEFFERDGDRLVPLRSNSVGPIATKISASERIFTGGYTYTSSRVSGPVVWYHVGDATDRAKLDWQSSDQWIQQVLTTKR